MVRHLLVMAAGVSDFCFANTSIPFLARGKRRRSFSVSLALPRAKRGKKLFVCAYRFCSFSHSRLDSFLSGRTPRTSSGLGSPCWEEEPLLRLLFRSFLLSLAAFHCGGCRRWCCCGSPFSLISFVIHRFFASISSEGLFHCSFGYLFRLYQYLRGVLCVALEETGPQDDAHKERQ